MCEQLQTQTLRRSLPQRTPKMALPTRTRVAPSAIAASRSALMPIDKVSSARPCALSEQRPAHLPPLQICLQVNISGEASKSGLRPEEVADVAQAVATLPGLTLRGLMAIPEPAADVDAQRAPHRALHALTQSLQAQGLALDTLSIGMSADLEAAIMEGATLVRIGSAIFGGRSAATSG